MYSLSCRTDLDVDGRICGFSIMFWRYIRSIQKNVPFFYPVPNLFCYFMKVAMPDTLHSVYIWVYYGCSVIYSEQYLLVHNFLGHLPVFLTLTSQLWVFWNLYAFLFVCDPRNQISRLNCLLRPNPCLMHPYKFLFQIRVFLFVYLNDNIFKPPVAPKASKYWDLTFWVAPSAAEM